MCLLCNDLMFLQLLISSALVQLIVNLMTKALISMICFNAWARTSLGSNVRLYVLHLSMLWQILILNADDVAALGLRPSDFQ